MVWKDKERWNWETLHLERLKIDLKFQLNKNLNLKHK